VAPKRALVYGILQAFASLKTRNITSRNLDRFARARITSGTCCASLNRERSEADERHSAATSQRSLDAIEYCVNSFRGISA